MGIVVLDYRDNNLYMAIVGDMEMTETYDVTTTAGEPAPAAYTLNIVLDENESVRVLQEEITRCKEENERLVKVLDKAEATLTITAILLVILLVLLVYNFVSNLDSIQRQAMNCQMSIQIMLGGWTT